MGEENKQEAAPGASAPAGCLRMSLVGLLSIGVAVAFGYAAQWLLGL